MTAFSFIMGVIPLLVATGAGFEMRRVLGTAVFSGMLWVKPRQVSLSGLALGFVARVAGYCGLLLSAMQAAQGFDVEPQIGFAATTGRLPSLPRAANRATQFVLFK